MRLLLRLSFIVFTLSAPRLLQAAIIYVNPSAAGANNGTSWANAYTSLASALAAATSGDEIWVKQGVYKPTTIVDVNASGGGADAREATFQVPNSVAVYGGFAGTEATRAERNWQTNLTILSGDIDNNDVNGDANSIAETTSDIVGNNAYHVIYTINVNANTRVDGFTITGGLAQHGGAVTDANLDGGGWYNQLNGGINASSPTMVNLTFQGNYSHSEGGAVFHVNGTAGAAVLSLVENCRFISNESNIAGGAVALGSFAPGNYQVHFVKCEFTLNEAVRRGGAIYMVGDHAILDTCTFNFNMVTAVAVGMTLPGSGGGVGMTSSNASFNHCMFEGNSATGNATGYFEGGGGGAVYMSSNEPQATSLGVSQPSFFNCGFYSNSAGGNTAAWGGAAVHLSDAGQLRPKYVNCVFYDNDAQTNGGAIANVTRVIGAADGYVPELTPKFTNCTFTANSSVGGGAIYNDGQVYNAVEILQARFDNCILWNDVASGSGNEILNNGSTTTFAYSLIQGSGGSGGGWVVATGVDGGNNKATNPSFVNAADADGADNIPATDDDGLRLNASSPAADAGNNGAAGLVGVTIDYRRGPRLLGAKVDMGAYERSGIVIPDFPIRWLYDWKPFPPFCLSCPWAIRLNDRIFPQFIWDGPAQLIEERNGATIKGTIINPKNKNIKFNVNIKLINKHTWAQWSAKGRTYTATSLEAILVAKRTHKTWTFWELSPESYLEGAGEISGKLMLTKLPADNKTGFQMGTGANGYDKDFGLGGTFSYKGTVVQNSKKIAVSGNGSINVDAVVCKVNCTPIRVSQLRSTAIEQSTDKSLSVFPVPARDKVTISGTLPTGMYSVKIYNGTGQLKMQQQLYVNKGNNNIAVNQLEQGIYVLQIVSSSGETFSKKLIIE